MANNCDNCGEACHRTRWINGRYLGLDCRCYTERVQASAVNPYGDLTLEHVHGEDGKPIRVTSSRQLSEAEKKHNFISVVRNMDQQNIDTPPVNRIRTVDDVYKRRFSRGA
jgi:hypothetical protein